MCSPTRQFSIPYFLRTGKNAKLLIKALFSVRDVVTIYSNEANCIVKVTFLILPLSDRSVRLRWTPSPLYRLRIHLDNWNRPIPVPRKLLPRTNYMWLPCLNGRERIGPKFQISKLHFLLNFILSFYCLCTASVL